MKYVDGFVLPLPAENLPAYRRMSRLAGAIWREHGALQYLECAGDDLYIEGTLPFPTLTGAGDGDTVVFAFIVYESREHRDEVNRKVMADPRLNAMGEKMPFDVKRMAYGGFDVIVEE